MMHCRWISMILLLVILSICSRIRAHDFAFSSVTPPYRVPRVDQDDLLRAHSFGNVSGVPELAGTLAYAMSPTFGPMFLVSPQAAARGEYVIGAQIVLPNSLDDPYACEPLKWNVTDQGETLAGKFVLIERGGCAFGPKALNVDSLGAFGVLLHGCDTNPPLNCPPRLTNPLGTDLVRTPTIFIATDDGYRIRKYLTGRRMQYANGTSSSILPPLPRLDVFGTGPLDPLELQAFRTVAQTIVMDPIAAAGTSALNPWSSILTNPSLDPCLSRFIGIWCEGGRITIVQIGVPLTAGGMSGRIDGPAWSTFKQLVHIDLSSSGLSGIVPQEICVLTEMRVFYLDSNLLTSLPDCIGASWKKLQGLSLAGNLLERIPDTFHLISDLASLILTHNHLTALPPSFYMLKSLWQVDLSFQSSQSLQIPPPSFAGWTKLAQLILTSSGITGSFTGTEFSGCTALIEISYSQNFLSGILPVGIFDSLPKLTTVVLSSNIGLGGLLPNFLGSTALETFLLNDCSFTGAVPDSWEFLEHLTVLQARSNQLTGPMSVLTNCIRAVEIDLQYNQIQNHGVGLGEVLTLTISTSLQTLRLDHNQLSGSWATGWFPPISQINTVTLSHNSILNLPDDFWSLGPKNWDVSFNNLTNQGFPPGIPSSDLTTLDLRGNPALNVWPLPSYLSLGTEDTLSTVASSGRSGTGTGLEALYTCKQLLSQTSSLLFPKVDPISLGYHGCSCARGSFGRPPLCAGIPEAAELSPYTSIQSEEVGQAFEMMLMTNASRLEGDQQQQQSSGKNTSSAVSVLYPNGFSDDYYGQARLTLGMNTNWMIDLRNVFRSSNDVQPGATIMKEEYFTSSSDPSVAPYLKSFDESPC